MAEKDRITCHVLDTSAGKPARGVRVKLELVAAVSTTAPNGSGPVDGADGADGGSDAGLAATGGPLPLLLHHGASAVPSKVFEGQTDDDGRIATWLPYSSATSAGEVPVYTLEDVLESVAGPSRWTLRFDTARYFGEAETFFPEVTVVFRVAEGQHYHVPLLLSPYSYTTYRGS